MSLCCTGRVIDCRCVAACEGGGGEKTRDEEATEESLAGMGCISSGEGEGGWTRVTDGQGRGGGVTFGPSTGPSAWV
ncbi:hypothetical protein B1218_34135 [Pseudomonas ogarae]|nr:hypothetical protein B1218_34135 [Pseudomonas ogarae]